MINPLQVLGEIVNALWPRDTTQQRTLPTADAPVNSRECRAPGPMSCLGCDWYSACALPTVPAGVSTDPTSVPPAGLPQCEHCQQPIEQRGWFHTGSQRVACVDIPGYPRTYATPQM